MNSPRILVWDIENLPAEGEFWGRPYNTNIIRVTRPASVCSFAAKWRGEKRIEFRSDFHDGHAEMVERARDLLDEADAVVSYNGKRHDEPHMMTEIKLAGLGPPSPFQQIDLCQVVRQTFKFQTNKLAFIAEQLEIGSKVKHEGHDLWVKVKEGDPKAWERFRKYNIQDVRLTDELFDELLPWLPPSMMPRINLFNDDPSSCGRCGGALTKRGFYYTAISKYQRYQCSGCGSWSRGKTAVESAGMRGVV